MPPWVNTGWGSCHQLQLPKQWVPGITWTSVLLPWGTIPLLKRVAEFYGVLGTIALLLAAGKPAVTPLI